MGKKRNVVAARLGVSAMTQRERLQPNRSASKYCPLQLRRRLRNSKTNGELLRFLQRSAKHFWQTMLSRNYSACQKMSSRNYQAGKKITQRRSITCFDILRQFVY